MVLDSGLGLEFSSSRFRVQVVGCRVEGCVCRVEGCVCRVEGGGCMVQGCLREGNGDGDNAPDSSVRLDLPHLPRVGAWV